MFSLWFFYDSFMLDLFPRFLEIFLEILKSAPSLILVKWEVVMVYIGIFNMKLNGR